MASADVDPSIFLSFSRKGRWIASSCQCVIAETLTEQFIFVIFIRHCRMNYNFQIIKRFIKVHH